MARAADDAIDLRSISQAIGCVKYARQSNDEAEPAADIDRAEERVGVRHSIEQADVRAARLQLIRHGFCGTAMSVSGGDV